MAVDVSRAHQQAKPVGRVQALHNSKVGLQLLEHAATEQQHD